MRWLFPIRQAKRMVLFLGDIAVLYLSLYLTLLVRYGAAPSPEAWQMHLWPFSLVFAVWVFIFYVAGLYETQTAKNDYVFYSRTAKTVIFAVVVTVLIFYFNPAFQLTPKTTLAIMTLVFSGLFVLWRRFYNALIRSEPLLNFIIFTGRNKEVDEIINMLAANPQMGYKSLGVIDPDEIRGIKEIVAEKRVKTVVHVKSPADKEDIAKLLCSLIPLEVNIVELPKFYEQIAGKIPVSIIGETWFLENLIEAERDIYKIWKRFFDVSLALVLGVIVLLLAPLIALAIKIDSRGSIFYRQMRVGKNGSVFRLLKFRTMVADAERQGIQWTKDEDSRVTRVGRVLRRLRIDELPQLWNVLSGDMSFVGPRPERSEFVEKLEKNVSFYQMRHIVKPGLTGLAQIYGPLLGASAADSLEKLQYDLYYIKNRSAIIDFNIIVKTIPIIIGCKGH